MVRMCSQEDVPTALKCQTLLSLSHFYAMQDDDNMMSDAFDCVYKAREFASNVWLPDIHAQLAWLCVHSDNVSDAIRHYESALAIDSNHIPSLIGLASIQHQLENGNLVLAYGYLTSALQSDATSHEAWYEMGLVFCIQGKNEQASENLLTALELERTAPIVSFSTIQRTL